MSRDVRDRQAMIEENLGLVRSMAARYRGLGVAPEDLMQEGTLGLVRAVERFDPGRGALFSTYAAWWIRRALADAVAAGAPIRIPPAARRARAAVGRAERDLRRRSPGGSTSAAIAARTGLTEQRVRTLRAAARVTASLDEPVGEAEAPLLDLVADPDPVDPWRRLDEREMRRQAWALLKLVPRRHREVLVRRYGILGDRGQSHAEIAAVLGIGEERSRQLEREALHRLRELGGGRCGIA